MKAIPTVPTRAVSVAIRDGERFLLVRRGRPPAMGLYAFPGGRVEAGERLDQAVAREALEETGASVADIRHLIDLDIMAEDGTGRVEFVLSVHGATYAGGDVIAGDDAAEALWVTLEEMASLPLAGSVLEIARQVAGR